MKSLKRKFIVSLIAIMFAIVALGASTYAYWSNINRTTEVTNSKVTIGEAKTSIVTASLQAILSEGTVLVPEDQIDNSLNPGNVVDSVTFNYEVFWEDNLATNDTARLTVAIDDLLLGGSNTYSYLVNTDIPEPVDIERNIDTATTVTITLTLREPGSKEVYDAIFGQNITFNVTFEVTPDPAP